jgi:hypothetical protein
MTAAPMEQINVVKRFCTTISLISLIAGYTHFLNSFLHLALLLLNCLGEGPNLLCRLKKGGVVQLFYTNK